MMELIKRTWKTMIQDPKLAIRQAIINHRVSHTIYLVILFGIILIFDLASNNYWGDKFSTFTIFFIAFMIGPLVGLLVWIFLAGVTFGLARLFGGSGSWRESRLATTWSIPAYLTRVFPYFFFFIIYRHEFFTRETSMMDESILFMIIFLILWIIEIIIEIWCIYIYAQALSEVHHFSAWKGFYCIIVPPVAWYLLLIILVLLLN